MPTTPQRPFAASALVFAIALLALLPAASAKPGIEIRGHLVASAACPLPDVAALPEGLLASRRPVPAEAGGRAYQVSGSNALVNSPKCLTWLAKDGKVLPESPGANQALGTGKVPQGAVAVVVQAVVDVQSDYRIWVK